MTALTRKEKEQQRKRDEILEASISVFAQKGYHGATMAEISQASEYPLGTIYKFFQGKENIYHEMVRETGIALGDILLDIISRREWPPSRKIKEYLRQYVLFGLKKRNCFLVYNSQRSSIDAVPVTDVSRTINRLHNKMLEILADIFREGVEKNEFRDFPPEEMAVMFSSITFAAIWSCAAEKDISGEQLDRKLDTIFQMFSKGVRVNC